MFILVKILEFTIAWMNNCNTCSVLLKVTNKDDWHNNKIEKPYAKSKGPAQLVHSRALIRVFIICYNTAKALVRLRGCIDWPGHSLSHIPQCGFSHAEPHECSV